MPIGMVFRMVAAYKIATSESKGNYTKVEGDKINALIDGYGELKNGNQQG